MAKQAEKQATTGARNAGGIRGRYARRLVAELVSDPANVRKHGEKNLEAIKSSLLRFGQQKPIVIDKSGVVRAGNGTLEAAKALGWLEIDCVESELEGAEATAYAIADNRTAELAEWDEGALTAVLQSLEHEDAGLLEAAGYSVAELEKLARAFNVAGAEMPVLASGDRAPFQQMTFTLHDSQAEAIRAALGVAKENGGAVSDVNDNSNGNALAWLAEQVLARG